jgi:outer membrane protein OmpA-like peptidoglycan-associated protein
MRSLFLSILLIFLPIRTALSQALSSQSSIYSNDGPRFDVAAGYLRIQANAPPGACNCFGNNGGFVDANFWLRNRFSITGEFSGSHENNISSLGQSLTLTTYMAGPHVVMPIFRIVPYWEFLLGAAHASDSYFPTGNTFQTSATSFAYAPGGGIDIDLTRQLSIRPIQIRYLHTTFPNGTSNEQNHLMIGAGIDYRFKHISRWASSKAMPSTPPEPAPVAPPPAIADVSCVSGAVEVTAGSPLQVTAVVQTTPAGQDVNYTWSSSGGTVQQNGQRATIDTTSLPAGRYHVTGQVHLTGDSSIERSCDVAFRIVPPAAPSLEAVRAQRERDFKENVHDVFFDLNKSDIRPDTETTLQRNAEYLKANPDVRILLDGFADERGAVKYNLALGEQRAKAVRDELISLGVGADRIQIVTFGHDAQTCTAGTEECWQQNRRVGFLMQP